MSLRQAFPELVPSRPFCANDFAEGIRIRPRGQALRHLHVQFNHPKFIRWLLLDLDRADAYFRDEDALLPAFNVLIRNPANGHAHAAYVLDVPVAAHDAARQKPLKLLAAVERGLVRRLAADRAYSGLLAKNPLHRIGRSSGAAKNRTHWKNSQAGSRRKICVQSLSTKARATDETVRSSTSCAGSPIERCCHSNEPADRQKPSAPASRKQPRTPTAVSLNPWAQLRCAASRNPSRNGHGTAFLLRASQLSKPSERRSAGRGTRLRAR